MVWSVALYAAETWTPMKADVWRLEAFEIVDMVKNTKK